MRDDFELEKFAVDGIPLKKLKVSTQIDDPRLTPSETDIAERLLRDQSYKEIASARGTTRSTVASQVQVIFEKLDVSSASELVAALARAT